jgi:hypothetical protein
VTHGPYTVNSHAQIKFRCSGPPYIAYIICISCSLCFLYAICSILMKYVLYKKEFSGVYEVSRGS